MTRNPPEGSQYGGGYGYQQQPPQYGYPQGQGQYGGESQQSYGNYQSNENPYTYQQPPQQGYGGPPGSSQSYYGSNEQSYQERPPQGYYTGPPSAPYGSQNQAYGQPDQYSGPPRYEQEYPPPQQYQQQQGSGSDVDAFRSHFDQGTGSYNRPPPPPPEGDERGLMGALAGGAAGGFGGHKMGHGVLGAVGGAVAGSLAQDAYKKHHHQQEQQHHGGGGGNFSEACKHGSIHLHGSMLRAEVQHHMGHQRAEIDLNDCMTNNNGHISWSRGGNFAASSRNLRLEDDGRVLVAEACAMDGHWEHNTIYLNERIANDNGRLVMIG